MATAADLHLLGIGYRMVRGGEEDFARASARVRRSGKEAAESVNAVDGAMAHLRTRFAGFVSPARAVDAALAAIAVTSVALVVTLGSAIRVSAEFEAALVGVGKTANIEGAALRALGDDVDLLSRRIPVASREILEIAQSAGQLGVQGSANILRFAETVAKLGRSSDLAGEEGATALAKILNVTGEATSTVGTLASVIVALGNNFAATESQIAHHTGEVARATAVYEIGSGQAAALGTTLAAFGVRAELAGSAVGRAFRVIEDAVKSGGEKMAALSVVSNASAEEIRAAWGRGPVEAFNLFLRGVRDADAEGKNIAKSLRSISLEGEEVLKVIPVLAKQFDTLARAQNLAARETADPQALETEFARAAVTLQAEFDLLRNVITSTLRVIGDQLAPVVKDIVVDLRRWFEANRQTAQSLGTGLAQGIKGAIAAGSLLVRNLDLIIAALVGIGAALLVVNLAPMVLEVVAATRAFLAATAALRVTSVALIGVSGAVATVRAAWASLTATLAANPVGIVAAVVAALAGTLVLLALEHRKAKREAEQYHAELESGVPIIDGQVRALDDLATRLTTEIRLRKELALQYNESYRALNALAPVLAEIEKALASGDNDAYAQALEKARALGVEIRDAGKLSGYNQVRAEVERLRAELDSTRAAQEQNALVLQSTQDKVRAQIEEQVDTEKRAMAERKALLADLALEAASTRKQIVNLVPRDFGDFHTYMEALRNLQSELTEIETKALKAGRGLRQMQENFAQLRNDALLRAGDLFQQGDYERGAQLARDVGVSEQEIKRAIEQQKALTAAQEEARRKAEELRRTREEAAEQTKAEIRRQEQLRKRYQETTAEIDRNIQGHQRIAQAYAQSSAAGRLAEQQVQDQARALQAASTVDEKYREIVRKRVEDEIKGERQATGSKTLARLRDQFDAATQLADAYASGLAPAIESARRQQALVEQTVANSTGAWDDQIESIEQWTEKVFRLNQQNAFSEQARQMELANEALEKAAANWDGTTVSIEQTNVALQIHNQIAQVTIGRSAEEAEVLARLIRQQERLSAVMEARLRLGRLEEETRRTAELAAVKRDDFLTEREYQNALAAVNTEHEVRSALITLQADRYRVLINLKRKDFKDETEYLKARDDANKLFDDYARRTEAAIRQQAVLNKQTAEYISLIRIVAKAGTAAFDVVKDSIRDALTQAIREGSVNWEDIWGSLMDRLLGIFLDMLEEMLARWIATQAAMRATAATAGGGAGGASGWLGFASSAVSASGVAGGAGAAGGGWASTAASFAWVLPVVIGLVAIYKGFIQKSTQWAEVNLQTGATEGNSRNTLRNVERRATEIIQTIQEFAAGLELQIERLGDVSLGKRGKKYYVRSSIDPIGRAFDSAEEAMEFAAVRAIQLAELGDKVSRLVSAAVRGSKANTLADLQSDIEFARELERQNVSEVVGQFTDAWALFINQMERAMTLFRGDIPALMIALDSIFTRVTTSLWDAYNSLTGRQEDPKVRAERERQAYNAQRTIIVAQITLLMAEIAARIALMEAQRAHLGTIHNFTGGILESAGIIAKAGGIFFGTSSDQIEALWAQWRQLDALLRGLPPEIQPGGVKPGGAIGGRGAGGGQSLRDMIAESERQRELDGMTEYGRAAAEINRRWDEGIKAAGNQDAALQRAQRRHREAIEAAKGNEEAVKKANEQYERAIRNVNATRQEIEAANRAREEELRLLRARTIEDLYGRVREYEQGAAEDGSPQAALAAIQAEAKILRDDFLKTAEELGFGAARIAAGLDRITAAERARIAALTEGVIDNLGLPMEQAADKARELGQTIAFLRDRVADGTITADRFNEVFGQMVQQASSELLTLASGILEQMGNDQQAAEIKAKLEEANFLLQVAQLNALYIYYRDLNLLSEEAIAILKEALGYINDPKNRPKFNPSDYLPNRGRVGSSGSDANKAAEDAQRRRQEILDQIKEWNRLGESDATSGLRKLNETLVSMTADAQRLGIALSDLMAAHANAVEDFWNRTLEPYESGESDSLLVQLDRINATFDELVAAAQLYGGSQARIEAARAAEVERFWDEALAPIRELQDRFQVGEFGGLSPEQRLQEAQRRFNDLGQRALSSDPAAIQALPEAVDALLEQQRAFSGSGPAYQALVATIQGVLNQVLSLGGGAGADVTAGVAPAAFTAGVPEPSPLAAAGLRIVRPEDPRPIPLLAGGSGSAPAPVPVPDDRVDRLVGIVEDEAASRREDRRANEDLRAEVDRLVEIVKDQQQDIGDLVTALERLSSLVESQERRIAQGGR